MLVLTHTMAKPRTHEDSVIYNCDIMYRWEATALWTLSLTMYEWAGLLPRPQKPNMNNMEFLEVTTKLT